MTVYDLFGSSKKEDPPKTEIFEGHDYLEFEKISLGEDNPKAPKSGGSWRLAFLFAFLFVFSTALLALHLFLGALGLVLNLLTLNKSPFFSKWVQRYALRSKIFFITSAISMIGIVSSNIAIMLLMTCLMIFVKQSHQDPLLSILLNWFNRKL